MRPVSYGAMSESDPQSAVPLETLPNSVTHDPLDAAFEDQYKKQQDAQESCAAALCPRGCLVPSPGYGPSWRWMVPLACCFLNECICLSMLYPFLGYMVWDFGIVDNKDDAGQYVGYIASMFTLGQLLTGSMWGRASDRFGRRWVICIGLFATMLLSPLFGLAQNLWQAMAVRFLMGLMNGNAAAAKAYIGEAVTKETQDLGFSLVAICWSFGNVAAAALGGFLCRPAMQYPTTFSGTIFEQFPYLLPCLVSSCFAGAGWLVTYSFLPEQPMSGDKKAAAGTAWSYILKHRRCHYVFAIYFLISWLDYGMFEVYPLWAITSVAAGGLGWSPAQVGLTQMTGGGMLLVGNLVFLPMLRQRFSSSLSLQRFAMVALAIPGFSLFPLASAALAWGGQDWAALTVLPIFFLRITSVGVIFTLSFQYINGMVDDRSILGGITGAAQQAGNVARFITPTVSAWLVAFGNSSTYSFPLDNRLPFVAFGLGWLLPLYFNLRLSEEDINKFQS